MSTGTELDLPAYLSGKGIRVYKAAGAEVTMHCWWCGDGDPKGHGKLYVNTESGLWSCKRCDTHGNRKTMLRHFGDEDKAQFEFAPGTNPALRRKALSNATELATEMLYNNPKILEYLSDRGLWPATLVAAKLGYVPVSWSLVRELRGDNSYADLRQAGLSTATGGDFFSGHVLIPYISHGDVVQLRGKSMVPGGKYVTPSDDNARLYNASSLQGARDAFIAEGELDTLIVQQYLRTSSDPNLRDMAVVGLPGANALPTSFASYFETCRRVYVGLDPDPVGEKAALRIKEMLGTKARLVRLPVSIPKVDWTDYLRPKTDAYPNGGHGLADIERLIFEADAEGRRLFTVRDAYQKWHKIDTEIGGIQLGFRDLDTWIAPGLKPGQLCVPLAKTGVGKTMWLINVIWNLRTRPTLLCSLEMSAAEVYIRLQRVANFWYPLATDADIARMFSNLLIYDRGMASGDMTRLLDDFNDEMGVPPQLVMLDYLGYYANQMRGGSPYERTSQASIGLKEEAKAGEVVLIAPHQVGRTTAEGVPIELGAARDSGAVEETADVLLSLYKPSDADRSNNAIDGTVRMEVLKNRNGRKNVTTSLNFSLASLVLVDKTSVASRTVEDENMLIARGDTYAAVRRFRRHQAGLGQQVLA